MPNADRPGPALGGNAHTHDPVANATDPTRTKTLRRTYAQRLRGSFTEIATAINTGVVERDIFGLRTNQVRPPPRSFQFRTDAQKQDAFMRWLHRQVRRGPLNVIRRDHNPYIQQAYHRGLDHADVELRKAGITIPPGQDNPFNLPKHRDAVQRLYTRNYEELRGVTGAMSQQISRELSRGFSQGKNPREIARGMVDRVDKIGRHRATVLARTEVINAYTEASLDRYATFDDQVDLTVKAEFLTAGDRRVCPECAALEGERYTVRQARGVIPVHPQCRCTWITVKET